MLRLLKSSGIGLVGAVLALFLVNSFSIDLSFLSFARAGLGGLLLDGVPFALIVGLLIWLSVRLWSLITKVSLTFSIFGFYFGAYVGYVVIFILSLFAFSQGGLIW
jgi:hypothetical protein